MRKRLLLVSYAALLSCNSNNNPKITYKDYKYEFLPDTYSKSITDFYKEQNKITNLSDREVAMKMNSDLILEDLIDNILRYTFLENTKKLNEAYFNTVKSRLTKYYAGGSASFYDERVIIDRTQQWVADSVVQNRYGGKIFFDVLKRTPKPKEAYKRMVIDLINKNEITISDDFLKKEILHVVNQYTNDQKEFPYNFNLIEGWGKK